jgi:hypothetical protein
MFFTLPTSAQQPKSFSCGSNQPEFTLGIKTQLSSKQLNSLCTCISSNLDETSKATGIELANMSKSTKVDEAFMERFKKFSKDFDKALQLCGGYQL